MDAITFTVYGTPKPAGSKTGFVIPAKGAKKARAVVVDANPNSRDWKNAVSSEASKHYQGELLTGPLYFEAAFYFPRPKSHYGSGKNSSVLKPTSSQCHIQKPDVLKLSRAVEDACTSVIWRDDAQIVDERITKHWGEPARVEITVTPLGKE